MDMKLLREMTTEFFIPFLFATAVLAVCLFGPFESL